jgi:hypothetical protein
VRRRRNDAVIGGGDRVDAVAVCFHMPVVLATFVEDRVAAQASAGLRDVLQTASPRGR